ncbi:MAG: GCN5-related N-acetyltransferase [Streptosporangiaceae bacterium]|nr:GCN5-related N-acetyltransferase [Streptosporangiaceae bacterium]
MATRGGGAGVITRHRQEPPAWKFGDLVIRRYLPADQQDVVALHHKGLAQVGLRPGDGVYYDHDFPHLQEVYLDNGGEFVVGESATALIPGARLIAMGGLRRVDDTTAEVVRLRVHPQVQRQGFGSAILLALEERAIELGYRVLHGDTTIMQAAALELYRRFGWRETRRAVICGIVNIYGEKILTPDPGEGRCGRP